MVLKHPTFLVVELLIRAQVNIYSLQIHGCTMNHHSGDSHFGFSFDL